MQVCREFSTGIGGLPNRRKQKFTLYQVSINKFLEIVVGPVESVEKWEKARKGKEKLFWMDCGKVGGFSTEKSGILRNWSFSQGFHRVFRWKSGKKPVEFFFFPLIRHGFAVPPSPFRARGPAASAVGVRTKFRARGPAASAVGVRTIRGEGFSLSTAFR